MRNSSEKGARKKRCIELEDEAIEWLKLPPDLQYKFMEKAEEEAKRIKENSSRLISTLDDLKHLVEPYLRTLPQSQDGMLIAAVDGSRSPILSRRLGATYGVFTASGLAIKDKEEVWEDHLAGQFKRSGALSPTRSAISFGLYSLLAERKMALEALEHSDHVILDGSFYGYLYTAHKQKVLGELTDHDFDVLGEINQLTEKIIASGRAIAAIKRTRSRTLEGYAYLKGLATDLNGITDKLALSYAMPARTYLLYEDLTQGRHPIELTVLAQRIEEEGESAKSPDWGDIDKRVYGPFEDMRLGHHALSNLGRLVIKAFEDAPACEVEVPHGKEDEMISILSSPGFFNEDTGLPIVLDMVDQLTSLGVRFIDEYADEIETQALQELYADKAPKAIRWFFKPLNPQKPYRGQSLNITGF
ncbi:MAG: DNA double-strand break repair nuclease NurA [Thermoprotei archaeon]